LSFRLFAQRAIIFRLDRRIGQATLRLGDTVQQSGPGRRVRTRPSTPDARRRAIGRRGNLFHVVHIRFQGQ
jgi:hypothetical protein